MAKPKPDPDAPARANVAQLKARLSEYLRQVKAGHEVVITERGVPVARLTPLAANERRATREERLIRAGLLRPPQAPRTKLGPPKGRPGAGRAVLEALLAEREEGY
jgi:prevent-host-death family protein